MSGPHPEQIAQAQAVTRERGRFVVEYRSSDSAAVYWDRAGWILSTATRCRAFRRPGAKRIVWPETHGRIVRGTVDVDLASPGIRGDAPFWSGIAAENAWRPIFTVPIGEPVAHTWFGQGGTPQFDSSRDDIPQSAITWVKREIADGATSCLVPVDRGDRVALWVFAAPDQVVQLVRLAMEIAPIEGDRFRDRHAGLAGLPYLLNDASRLSSDLFERSITGRDPEKRLRWLLLHRPSSPDPFQVREALAAAELIATLEQRPTASPSDQTDGDWRARIIKEWCQNQDALAEETIETALQVVRRLEPNALVDRTILTEQLRSELEQAWRRTVQDVERRLDAALRTRRVRAVSPNAVTGPETPLTPAQMASPGRRTTFSYYALQDDVRALAEFLLEETGAMLAVKTATWELAPVESLWSLHEVLQNAFEGGFDSRVISDFRQKQSGVRVLVWWPDLSPAPYVRDYVRAWNELPVDPETEEFMASLVVGDPGFLRPPSREIAGWGWASFILRGASDEEVMMDRGPERWRLLLQSTFEYPTGAELTRSRYQGDGPWREVDWKGLRKMIHRVRQHMSGTLAGGHTVGPRPIPVLRHAAARLTDGGSWRPTSAGEDHYSSFHEVRDGHPREVPRISCLSVPLATLCNRGSDHPLGSLVNHRSGLADQVGTLHLEAGANPGLRTWRRACDVSPRVALSPPSPYFSSRDRWPHRGRASP